MVEPKNTLDRYLAKGGLNRGHIYLLLLTAVGGSYEHSSKSSEIADLRDKVTTQLTDQKVDVAILKTQQQQTNIVLAQISDDLRQVTRSFDRMRGDRPSSAIAPRPAAPVVTDP